MRPDAGLSPEATLSPSSGVGNIHGIARGRPIWLLSLASVVIVVAAWELGSGWIADPLFLPGPAAVVSGLLALTTDGSLVQNVGISLGRILTGWLLGSAIGAPLGLAIGSSRVVKAMLDPFIHFFRFIPPIALVTLFLAWLGVGEASKVLLIAYTTAFIVVINTAIGVTVVPSNKTNAARCLGATEGQVFLHVTVPATVPYIFVGMRLAMASSFLVIVAAEMLAADAGLGYLIWTSRLFFRVDWIFAALVVLGLLGFLTDRLWRSIGATVLKRYARLVSRY